MEYLDNEQELDSVTHVCYSKDRKKSKTRSGIQEGLDMMTNRHYRTGVTNHIFGSYIMNMKQVPGREEKEDAASKERERHLFEMVDDYIEQA